MKELEDCLRRWENGDITPIQLLYWLKLMRKNAEELIGYIKAAEKEHFDTLAEAAKESGAYKNAVFTYKNGGATYKWDGVPEVKDLEARVKAAKKKYIASLQATDKGALQVDPETGELIPLPERKYSASSISVKFN